MRLLKAHRAPATWNALETWEANAETGFSAEPLVPCLPGTLDAPPKLLKANSEGAVLLLLQLFFLGSEASNLLILCDILNHQTLNIIKY